MGCDYYTIEVPQTWSSNQPESEISKEITFSFFGDEETGCLCTFPFNYKEDPDSVPVKRLAMLGAAIVLGYHNLLPLEETHPIRSILPEWVLEGIDKKVIEE